MIKKINRIATIVAMMSGGALLLSCESEADNLGYQLLNKNDVALLGDFTRDIIAYNIDNNDSLRADGRIAEAIRKDSIVLGAYQDEKGFCFSAELKDIQKHDYVLTPGRYVGAVEQEDDGEPFAEKMARLTGQLKQQFAESAVLEAEIKKNLAALGYTGNNAIAEFQRDNGLTPDGVAGKRTIKKIRELLGN